MLLEAWKTVSCPVIGMLHAPPLPGSPRGSLTLPAIRDFVLRDADTLATGGVHGLMLENFGDVPFHAGRVPAETLAQLTWLAAEVRRHSNLPLGINVLRNDGESALAIAAAVGGSFVRVNILSGARLTDQGIIAGRADSLLRLRRQLGAESIRILADVAVKHSAPLAQQTLAAETSDLVQRALADAVIVTGSGTGHAAAEADFRQVKQAAGQAAVFVGSGISPESAGSWRGLADGLIVGSALKIAGQIANPIDPQRVRQLIATIQA